MVWALQHIPKGTNHDSLEAGGNAMREATAGQLLLRADSKKYQNIKRVKNIKYIFLISLFWYCRLHHYFLLSVLTCSWPAAALVTMSPPSSRAS
jgi:hypothetical protein